MERYLLQYLKDSSNDPLTRKYIDYLKVELDWFIYNYGDHMATTHIRNRNLSLKGRINRYIQNHLPSHLSKSGNTKRIVSSLPYGSDELFKLGFDVYSSILQPVGRKRIIKDSATVRLRNQIYNAIHSGIFDDLYNYNLFKALEENIDHLAKQYRDCDFKALLLYTDQYFESKYLIDVFKRIGRPSFIFSHGLPGIYSKDVDQRADYTMVWGEKIKENIIKFTGMDSERIHVVGNPKYKNVSIHKNLRNSLDDILVIPISSVLWHQHEWGNPLLIDRSMVVLYLYQVQHVLQQFGVKKARFRPHPAMDKDWVYGFLDKDFYIPDYTDFTTSLTKSSLIVGSSSTTFLEALMNGVNYLIYDPKDDNGLDMLRTHRYPPFDGSQPDLEIATTTAELEYQIRSKQQTSAKILEGYIQPLDLTILNRLIS